MRKTILNEQKRSERRLGGMWKLSISSTSTVSALPADLRTSVSFSFLIIIILIIILPTPIHDQFCNYRTVCLQADLNAPDARGLRPIHLASMAGMTESVLALVAAGVPIDAMGTEGNTALHLAAFHKQEGVVAILMKAGAQNVPVRFTHCSAHRKLV